VVLCDVRHAQVVMLPHLAQLALVLCRVQLSAHQVQQRGFARAVHSNYGHSASQIHPGSDALENQAFPARVLEEHVTHLHDRLGVVTDSFQLSWNRED